MQIPLSKNFTVITLTTEHLGFYLCNLLIPGDPQTVTIRTDSGSWTIDQEHNFQEVKQEIEINGKVGRTYAALNDVPIGAYGMSASMDAAFEELLPLCLGASYLTGLAVTPHGSTPHSFITFMQVGDHFPRARAMNPAAPGIVSVPGSPITSNGTTFVSTLEAFMKSYPGTHASEKTRLLVHHWLDALACWSLEDLVLSTATMLEIIAATAGGISKAAGTPQNTFNQRIQYAATRFGLSVVSSDFRNMRNDLVHEGTLSATKFAGKVHSDCTKATAEALNWIDQYLFAALGLGAAPKARFSANTFNRLNAFSL